MKYIKTETGFSILQAVIMTGLISTFAVLGTGMISNQKTAQKTAELRGDLESLNALVQTVLQDKANCTANFTPGQPVSDITQIVTDASATGNSESVITEGGKYLFNKLTVDSISVGSDPVSGLPDRIEVVYHENQDKLKFRTITKSIPIRFNLDASGNFQDCFMDEKVYNSQLYEEFCNLPGLANFLRWESSGKDHIGTCQMVSEDCSTQPGTIFQGFDSNRNPICKKITDIIPPDSIFDTSASACVPEKSDNVKLQVINNKIQITCSACVPNPSCATLAAEICPGFPVGPDNCGNDCGTGTKLNCVECSECPDVSTICQGVDAGVNDCGTSCGVGTKDCSGNSCKKVNSFDTAAFCVGNKYTTDEYDVVDGNGKTVGACLNEHGHPECKDFGYTNNCPTFPGCPAGGKSNVCNQTCDDVVPNTCTTQDVGVLCGKPCGMGTKNCSCSGCPDLSTICQGVDAGDDSCGNSCGTGTKDCGDKSCKFVSFYQTTATCLPSNSYRTDIYDVVDGSGTVLSTCERESGHAECKKSFSNNCPAYKNCPKTWLAK